MTVRANLQQLIGGATEETIIARVGEGIVSAIGSANDHRLVLANPDMISKTVLAKRLDSQTAFEIVSIDIADMDVGENIGARLQADQAEADTRVAQARAEGRRAMAVAAEQERIAEIEQSRARLVEAEAEVPKGMAEAFRSGRLGIIGVLQAPQYPGRHRYAAHHRPLGQRRHVEDLLRSYGGTPSCRTILPSSCAELHSGMRLPPARMRFSLPKSSRMPKSWTPEKRSVGTWFRTFPAA